MEFIYRVRKKDGTVEEGEKESISRVQLAHDLHLSGSEILSIEEKGGKGLNMSLGTIPFFNGVKIHEKILFAHNLSGMLKAGLALPRALQVLEKQTRNDFFKKVIGDLVKTIDSGGTLSGGMEHHPKVFQNLYVSMVRAGEESGNIPESLKEIADNLEKIYSLQKKVKGALTYPAVILAAIIGIGTLMMIFVVPTITGTFKEMGVPLPATTRFVIGVSDFLSNHTLIFFACLVIFVTAVTFIFRSPKVKPIISQVTLRLPVIGTMVKEINSARTARTMTALLSAGVSLLRALEITKEVVQSPPYQRVIADAMLSVEKGAPVSEVFKKNQKLYPIMVGEMIEVGEDTGEISHMLAQIAEFYEEEVDNKTKNLSTIIEPVLMIFIGIAVGFFAISMLTPMYSLMDTIK